MKRRPKCLASNEENAAKCGACDFLLSTMPMAETSPPSNPSDGDFAIARRAEG